MVAYQIFWGDLICMYVTLMHEIGITIIMPPVWSTCECVLRFRRLLPRHPKVFWVTTPFPLWTDDTEDCLPWSSSPARHDLLSNMLNFNGQHLAFLPLCSSLNMADGFCFSRLSRNSFLSYYFGRLGTLCKCCHDFSADAERTGSVEQITKRVQMTVLINITLQTPGK